MNVYFGQVYLEPGVTFPFSIDFQGRISDEISALVKPSATYIEKYGKGFELLFNISAKKEIKDNEIAGPSVYRKAKDVEYTIFLPYDVICNAPAMCESALAYVLNGACSVFESLDIDPSCVVQRRDSLIKSICADDAMFEECDSDSDY